VSRIISGPKVRIEARMTIFDESTKFVSVESQRLVIRGVLSGNVLVIKTGSEFPLSEGAFSPGQLITLSDPACGAPN
jgi:hypothetical protein